MALILARTDQLHREAGHYIGLDPSGAELTAPLVGLGKSLDAPVRVALKVAALNDCQAFIDAHGLTTYADDHALDNDPVWRMKHGRTMPASPPKRVITLAMRKQARIERVDTVTTRLLTAGFSVNNKLFSSSEKAQLKWLGMYTSRADLTYPIDVPTSDDTETVELADAADVVTYYGELRDHVQSILTAGVSLKTQIMGAVDVTALQAIQDPRV